MIRRSSTKPLGAIDPDDSIGVARQQPGQDDVRFGRGELAYRHGEPRKWPHQNIGKDQIVGCRGCELFERGHRRRA